MRDDPGLGALQLAKAQLSVRADRLCRQTIQLATTLARLTRDGAPPDEVGRALAAAHEASRRQLQLIVEAAALDRRIEEVRREL